MLRRTTRASLSGGFGFPPVFGKAAGKASTATLGVG
jgi:hypothetical protein